MKKRLFAVTATALAVCGFVGVSSAAAATEFGSSCNATKGEPMVNLVSLKHAAASPLPVTAPISGVITEWKMNAQVPTIKPEEEAIVGPAGGTSFTLVGESFGLSPVNFHGTTTNLSRLPVQAGDYLGLGGFIPLYCETADPADEMGVFKGSVALNSTQPITSGPGYQVPVVARVEPDVDGDGYGDETQDKCPQSAAYQTACPVVTISSLPTVGSKAVTVYVSTSLSAPVGVTATVKLGKGKTATLTAATQTVAPGSLTPFTLTLTSQVTKALKALPTKKSLAVSISASATNITGAASTSATTAKLKGQAKPVPHKKKPKKK
jgi:hypothetical protein